MGNENGSARVAIVGSGPAGFYAADSLLKRDRRILVDMFERLPTPYGLVRFGVAPDHQKIKSVTRVFDRTAAHPDFRFFGNVEIGKQIALDELRSRYHAVCFATGAQTDRNLGIPGEDLKRSHPATDLVAWYNGHPDFKDLEFDFSIEKVAVVGVGNVAVDVARILSRPAEELAQTDMADYAIDALANSNVREIFMIGRRGPAQAAFTNAEVKELGELTGVNTRTLPEETALDDLSRAFVTNAADRKLDRRLEILNEYSTRTSTEDRRSLTIRFLLSPTEISGDSGGGVDAMTLERNELYSDNGNLRPRGTGKFEKLDVDMVFRSVGYRGVAIPGLPFDDWSGTIPNDAGSVTSAEGSPMPGLYVSGWIKRGPTGIIGTNKPDGVETANSIVSGLDNFKPEDSGSDIADLLVTRNARHISWDQWVQADKIEIQRGGGSRPRNKLVTPEEVFDALQESEHG